MDITLHHVEMDIRTVMKFVIEKENIKIPSDGKLFKNENIYDKKYAGYTCTASCGLKKQWRASSSKVFQSPNGSISIMK